MRRDMIHCRARHGFTLLELVIVTLIMGIMAAAAAPTFTSSLLYHRTEAAALRIKNDLELVRKTAMNQSEVRSLQFDSPAAYSLPGISSLNRPAETYAVDLSQMPYDVQVSSVDFGGYTSVQFNGFGLPSSEGTIVVQAGSHQRQVSLDAQGNVTITQL